MIFGFSGKKRVGKNTAGEYLKTHFEKLGRTVVVTSFAEPLKEAICTLFIIDPGTLEDIKDQPLADWGNLTPRDLLKRIGDVCRDIDTNTMVKNMRKRIESYPNDTVVIITDIRYDVEAEMVQDLGGKVVIVERKGSDPTDTHSSEQGIGYHLCDFVISNDASRDDLGRKVVDTLA